MTEFQILSALADHNGYMLYTDLLNLTLTETPPDPIGTSRLIRALLTDKLLSGSAKAFESIYLEPAGQLRLDQLRQEEHQRSEERADREAQEKRGFRHDLICAAAGSAATLLAEFLFKLLI